MALNNLAEDLDLVPLASWFTTADVWANEHLMGAIAQAVVGLGIMLCLCLAFRGSSVLADNRAAASFWILAAMASYDPSAFWSYAVLYFVALVVAAVLVYTKADFDLEDWLIFTPASVAVAALWLPIVLVSWVLARTQGSHAAAVSATITK